MANSNKNVLGIEAIGAPQSTFAQIRTQVTDRTIGTAFRDGWQGDYPSMMEFLEPLFVTGAGSNDVDYSPGVRRGRAAEAAPALPESCALTNAALRVLLRDMRSYRCGTTPTPLPDYERIVKS